MRRKTKNLRQAQLEKIEYLLGPGRMTIQPVQHIQDKLEHEQIFVLVLHHCLNEFDNALAVCKRRKMLVKPPEHSDVAAFGERLHMPGRLPVQDDLYIRHGLQGRSEPASGP